MEHPALRGMNRPRSLCDTKLLSVSPLGVHHHVPSNGHVMNGHVTNGQDRKGSDFNYAFRGSWPRMMDTTTPTSGCGLGWNGNNGWSPYPAPLTTADKAPSMAGLLNTTVPQRLVTRPVRGQHTPTRHSLRHSRMISLIQQGKVPRKYLSPVIHHYKLGTSLVLIQLILGFSLLALAFYLLLWTPHLRIQDVPHWSASSLILSGIFGMFLMFCCRKPYPGMRGGCCAFAVRVQYIIFNAFLAMVASAACLSACVFAGLHVSQLFSMECLSNTSTTRPDSAWNSSCLCQTSEMELFTYDPLSCTEVENVLPVFLVGSAVVHGIAVFISIWYILLLWYNRFSYSYAGLKIAEQKAAAMSSLY